MTESMTDHTPTPAFFDSAGCDPAEFEAIVSVTTQLSDYPYAVDVDQEVLVYDAVGLRTATESPAGRRSVMAELAAALRVGPGVVVIRDAVELGVVSRVTHAFEQLIQLQHAAGSAVGDHFAVPGANDRVWNALEKLALLDPGAFVDYYANDMIALACLAWLGPGYQVTSQVNVVNPGGAAQSPHRDYHLGFMSDEQAAAIPAHAHLLSAALTLQGAVAHCEMPVATGPTKLLPHSHKYPAGYVAWRRTDFSEYFEQHYVQQPLAAGDAMFFNPALFHAAGPNVTGDVRRMANLLQVSSAMGRAMESVDRARIIRATYSALRARVAVGWPADSVANAVAACAEGYAFPTNLDRDPPLSGLAPASQADLVHQALAEGWTESQLDDALDALDVRRRTG